MAIKVDLEKAYERFKWSFISETLYPAGFPTSLIIIVMNCISSVKMQVLWNGEQPNSFLLPVESDRETPFPLISLCYVWNSLLTLSQNLLIMVSGSR